VGFDLSSSWGLKTVRWVLDRIHVVGISPLNSLLRGLQN
jgi:hypothetical protein